MILKYILGRLREPSTWLGVGLLLVGTRISTDNLQTVSTVIAAFMASFLPDSK